MSEAGDDDDDRAETKPDPTATEAEADFPAAGMARATEIAASASLSGTNSEVRRRGEGGEGWETGEGLAGSTGEDSEFGPVGVVIGCTPVVQRMYGISAKMSNYLIFDS